MFKHHFSNTVRVFLIAATLAACSGDDDAVAPPPAPPESPPVVQEGVSCTVVQLAMRDGVRLHTEVYRPIQEARLPTIVIRNPYGRPYGSGCFKGLGGPAALAWVKNGYTAVAQEVRGTNQSEGRFEPFVQEQNDGYDTIEWAARQPWSSGKVGTHVGSYLGAAQWQAALSAPPSLAAITPSVTPHDYRDDWVARNGVYDLQFARSWGLLFVPDGIAHKFRNEGRAQGEIDAAIAEWNQASAAANLWRSSLPLSSTWSRTAREFAPYIWDWYAHPDYDDYWARIDVGAQVGKVKVPALVSGGWYDLFAKGTVDSYLAIKTSGGSAAARSDSMLVMDCCGHGSSSVNDSQITWGPPRIGIGQNSVAPLTLQWMNKYLKGDPGIDAEPRVQLSVMVPPDSGTRGDTFILKSDAFPIPGTREVPFALASEGRANSSAGDGRLVEDGTPSGAPDTFVYDPLDPVPSVGGNAVGQALDQRGVERRPDVLVYTSPVLASTRAVIGKVTLRFWASSSAVDTDFTAKLVDVHPDGYAHNVLDNIVRAKYRRGAKLPPARLTPGTPVEFVLDLGYTATLFKPGHRIRLDISSSNFPHYARNLNTGDSENSERTITATQTIHHDAAMPSVLVLPVVPGVEQP